MTRAYLSRPWTIGAIEALHFFFEPHGVNEARHENIAGARLVKALVRADYESELAFSFSTTA